MDMHIVCSMCGDVGFPEKLFRCNKCSIRFQHSYCSNYYREGGGEAIEICDWCKSDEMKQSKHAVAAGSSSCSRKLSSSSLSLSEINSGSSGKIMKIIKKQRDNHQEILAPDKIGGSGSGSGTGSPSPRTVTRRYKLLKDVISANK